MKTKPFHQIARSGGQFLLTLGNTGKQLPEFFNAKKTGGIATEFCQSLGEITVSARFSSRSVLQKDPNSCVALILHGELCHDDVDILDRKEQVRRAHAYYLQGGIDGLTQWLNGSFLVCIVDQPRGVVYLLTDRLGSKKAFLLEQAGATYIASSMHLLPRCPIDPVGAATYLNNAFNFSDRTVLDGVRSLKRASVHSFSPQGYDCHEYWNFDLSAPSLTPTIEQARNELADLTYSAVRKRVPATGRIYISLSGGIDSRAILGCLLETVREHDRIIAVSYGEPNDGDVATATRLAKYAGIVHRITGFCGDLATTIRRNGSLGEGMVDFYTHGLDGLYQSEDDFSTNDILFVGDTVAQRGRSGFLDVDEVLVRGMEIRSPAVVPEYYSFGEFDCDALREQMNAELSEFKDCLHGYQDLQALHDYLFIDQRTANVILPWREFHANRFVTVANPLLDNTLLDFYRDRPASFRLDKALHRETIPLMFPELCAVPFAESGVNNRFIHQQLSTRRKAMTILIDDFSSRLDALLPPELIDFALQDTARSMALEKWPLPISMRSLMDRTRRRYLKGKLIRKLSYNQRSEKSHLALPALGAIQMERILTLRYFLS